MTHPEADHLSAFARGQLAPADADDVERHLAECPECCERAALAGKDGFIACLQSAAAAETRPSALLQATQAERLGIVPAALRDHHRYRVVRLLGRGGMGEVYLAEHRVMQRMVALKVIRQDLVSSPELADRFRREVLAAAKLSHPNIVAALDAEQVGETHFLVMEYVEGASVASSLREQRTLPVVEACDIVRQAALALQHAHEQGLVHRDIKPENLLRGANGTVKVADFGLARLPRAEETSTTTSAGILIGTVDYIAPEQANDSARTDIRADIYSLGCTLYHLLAGQVPYPGGGVLDKLARHMAGRPMRLTQLRPDVPLVVARVIERMMSPDAAKRFATPAEVASALAPWCAVQPARKEVRRWPLVAAALLGLLALLAGVVVYTVRTGKGTIEVRTEDPDVTVSVRKNGEEVVVIDEKTDRKVTVLPVGEYDLVLNDNGKRLELSTDRVKVTRNGKVIVEVKRIPARVVKEEPTDQGTAKDKTRKKEEPTRAEPTLPADLTKLKPAIDDDFRDPKVSTFDPTGGKNPKVISKKQRIEADFSKTEGYVVQMEPLQSEPRHAISFPDDSVATNFACRLSGKVKTDDAAFCALVLRGKHGAEFTVRVWNTGKVDTGRFLETAANFALPKLGPTPEKAVRQDGEKNDLLIIVEGMSMRVYVNAEQVGGAVALPKGLEEVQVGFLVCQTGSGAARFVVSRFTLWKLK